MASRIWSAPTSTLRGRPGEEVAPAERDPLDVPLPGVRGRDRDLDVLRRALAEEQVVLAPGERDDVLVHLVATDADAPRDDDAAEADDRDLGRAAADVDDEAAGRLRDGQPGPDRGGHRLLDEPCPARPGVHRGIEDGALLDLGDAGRDAQDHPRARDEADALVHLVDEVPDHLLGHVEVADDAVAERPDRDDVGRGPPDHPLGLGADREHLLGLRVDRHDARLAHDDAPVADMDERVRGPEVDPDVAREQAEQSVEHERGRSPCRGNRLRRDIAGGPSGCLAGRAISAPVPTPVVGPRKPVQYTRRCSADQTAVDQALSTMTAGPVNVDAGAAVMLGLAVVPADVTTSLMPTNAMTIPAASRRAAPTSAGTVRRRRRRPCWVIRQSVAELSRRSAGASDLAEDLWRRVGIALPGARWLVDPVALFPGGLAGLVMPLPTRLAALVPREWLLIGRVWRSR